jgi:hypothetical protein
MIRKNLSLITICGLTLLSSCGGISSSNESSEGSETSITQPTEAEPTWVINAPGDAFSAAAAQTVCDLMRAWATPIETSSAQVAELEKYADSLRGLVGSPTDAMYSASHAKILGHAEALLLNEEQYPTEDVMPASFGWIDGNCENLGLTPENSRFGLKESNNQQNAETTRSTAASPNAPFSAESILLVVCDELPERTDQYSWACGEWDGTNAAQRLRLYSFETEDDFIRAKKYEIDNFMQVDPRVRAWIEAATFCGQGWILKAYGENFSTSLAEKTYEKLNEAKIFVTKC